MDIFDSIFSISESTEVLDQYISDNIDSIYEFHNKEYLDIKNLKDSIEKLILLKYGLIENLDYSKSYNKAFISILLEFSERFNLTSATLRVYSILESKGIHIGLRLQAGLLFLYNIDTNSRLIERFEKICSLIEKSIELEEDNSTKAICTFLNYYATVIINTPSKFYELFIHKLNYSISNNKFYFLKNSAITEVIKIRESDPEICYQKIQSIIDKLLDKNGYKLQYPIDASLNSDILLEQGTDYANLLSECNVSFKSIRDISINKLNNVIKKEELFISLGRGVNVLDKEEQLLIYMKSFGNMHYEKLFNAFEYLPYEALSENISLIDWGCGQAMATITFYDFYKNNKIKNVALIEPSKLAIKRGALHVRKYDSDVKINTINKDLDSLNNYDLSNLGSEINIHFFSNILDIDLFSLRQLTKNIEDNFKGINIFVCVSPYITDLKTNRLDTFMSYFMKRNNFKIHFSINNRVGEWKNNWSRVTRVFSLNI
jgi:hypothetical protein